MTKKPRRSKDAHRPPRANKAANELIAFRATTAERRRYESAAKAAGFEHLGVWLRSLADKASTPRSTRKG